VVFIASSGDAGGATEWPAVSPNVVAVGGTALSISDSLGTYVGETGWSGSGGGISAYETKPSYQATVTQSSTKRTSPDVSFVGASSTPVAVYVNGGWTAVYGTSVGAPQWAGIVAVADQGKVLGGQGTLDGRSQLLPALYSVSANDFHDVTSGSAGGNTAGPGYDLVTGRGSPVANLLIADLLTVTGTAGAASGPVTGSNIGGTDTSAGGQTAFAEIGTGLGAWGVIDVMAWGSIAGYDLAAGAIIGFDLAVPTPDGTLPGIDPLYGKIPGSQHYQSPARPIH
jgi:subtilase family serine protease